MQITTRRLLSATLAPALAGALVLGLPATGSAAPPGNRDGDPATTGLFGQQDPTFDGVYRQSLSLIALQAAGARVPATSVRWLLRQQCANGKFTSFRSDLDGECGTYDSNATALASIALKAVGEGRAARSSLNWLAGKQLAGGGWEYSPGWGADASSTGYAVQAMIALGVDPRTVKNDRNGLQYLRSLQLDCGHGVAAERGALTYFGAADGFSTVQATPALANTALPVEPAVPAEGLPGFTCPEEGSQPSAAAAAAGYLGRVIDDNGGTVPGFGGGPDFGNTANAVLSLVAAGHGAEQVDVRHGTAGGERRRLHP